MYKIVVYNRVDEIIDTIVGFASENSAHNYAKDYEIENAHGNYYEVVEC